MELTFAKQEIENLKTAGLLQRSATLSLLLDLKVMLEDGDAGEALTIIKQYVGEEE